MIASPRIAMAVTLLTCLLLPACTADRPGPPVSAAASPPAAAAANAATSPSGSPPASTSPPDDGVAATEVALAADPPLPGTGDPGVDVVLGEWALVPSAVEAPPGTTTFRFRNMGTVPHGLRIRTPGSGGDRLEWRSEVIAPGESGLLVVDLAPGTYEVDCPVEGVHGEHDQLGMEMVVTVRDGAPALAPMPAGGGGPAAVADGESAARIEAFAFDPAELRVPAGTEVTWTNADPTPHTATGDTFDTGVLEQGAAAAVTFETSGTFDYVCVIHPTMQGRVVVDP